MFKTTNPVYRKFNHWRMGFIALCALFTCLSASGQTMGTVAIGSGTTANYGMPFDSYNFFNYSQQIVKASDFDAAGGSAGQITAVRFYIAVGLEPFANWQNWTVYVGHTSKSSFASTTDWEPLANLTQVFSGNITSVDGQWLEITFSTPFNYNGTSNLIVAVDENSPGKTNGFSATTFGNYTSSANTGLVAGAGTDINPAAPPTGARTGTLARLQFNATLASCLPASNLHADVIATSTATLTWTPPQVVPADGYQAYVSSVNTAPTASTEGIPAQGNSVSAGTLVTNTLYYTWIRSVCGNTFGNWIPGASFTTLCEPTNLPYTENFESVTTPALPSCTSAIKTGPANIWATASPAAYGFTNKALRYSYSFAGAADTWFFTRGLNLTAGVSYRLAYKYGGSGYTEKMEVSYGMATDAASMTQIVDYPEITGNTPTLTYVDFTPSTSGVYYIGFHAYSASGQNYLLVDDISVIVTPTCNAPTGVTAAASGANSGIVNWTPDGVSAGYQYYYNTTNTAPTAATTELGTAGAADTSANISGLAPNTTYYVWVRNNCGNNDLSMWSQNAVFTTLCEATNVPYTQNFESVTTPALPACTLAVNEGLGNNWNTTSPAANGFNSKVLRYPYTFAAAANAWFYTQGLNLTAGVSYRLSYKYGGSGYTEKMEVSYGMDTNSSAMTQLNDHPSITGSTPTVTYVDFTPSTTGVYYIGFHAYSAAGQNSLYVDDISVIVTPTCNAPTGLMVMGTGVNSVDIMWTPDGVSAGYHYYYNTTGTAPTPATTELGTAGATDVSTTVPGLNPNTTYYIWVRNNCGNNDLSAWSQSAMFTTMCEATNVPYVQDFESVTTPALPACTKVVNEGTGNVWNTTSPATANFNTKVLRYPYTFAGAANTWFYTRGINLTAGTSYRIAYKYGGSGYTEKLEVAYGMDTQSSAMVQLADHPSITGSAATINYVDFTPATTGVYYMGFHAYSAAGQNSLYVDDISVTLSPTCFSPTGVTAQATGTHTAIVNWTPAGTPSEGYEYYYNTVNTAPAANVNPQGTAGAGATSANVADLASGTVYYIWVRSNCGNNDLSQWSFVATFTTECEAANVPYVQNFESVTTPALPVCAVGVNEGTGNSWNTVSPSTTAFNSKALRYPYSLSNPANAWFFTQGINMTAGVTYRLSYKYGGSGYTEKLAVAYGNSATSSAMTQLADHPSITGSAATSTHVDFTPGTTGIYYIGFHAYSAAGQNSLYVDDISVDAVLGTGGFDASSFRYFPNPVKDVLNISYSSDITGVSVYNLLGQLVLAREVNATETAVDMSALADGTYIVNITSGENVKTLKVVKKQ